MIQPYDPRAGWTYGDTIADIEHVGWHWPDGIHTKAELDVLEPGRRTTLPDACPCRNCARDRAHLSGTAETTR